MYNEVAGAADMLDSIEALQERVKADRRPASVPLQVLAIGAGVFALSQWIDAVIGSTGTAVASLYWAIVAPVGFAVVARRYRSLELGLGVGTERRAFRILAVVALLSLVFFPILTLPLAVPYVVLGIVLLVIARRMRSGWLATGALAFGVLGSLESFLLLSNRVFDVVGSYVSWAEPAAWTGVALVLAAIAWSARRSETSR